MFEADSDLNTLILPQERTSELVSSMPACNVCALLAVAAAVGGIIGVRMKLMTCGFECSPQLLCLAFEERRASPRAPTAERSSPGSGWV
jgi:hypothetical protein